MDLSPWKHSALEFRLKVQLCCRKQSVAEAPVSPPVQGGWLGISGEHSASELESKVRAWQLQWEQRAPHGATPNFLRGFAMVSSV